MMLWETSKESRECLLQDIPFGWKSVTRLTQASAVHKGCLGAAALVLQVGDSRETVELVLKQVTG